MTLSSHLKIVTLSSLLIMSISAPAFSGVRDACKSDFKTYCDGIKKGKGRIRQCLKDHEVELSEPCRAALNEAETACATDREKFCADAPEGEGRVMECLKDHRSELSEACQAAAK